MENLPSVINVVSDERSDNYMYFDGGAAIKNNHDILVVSEDSIATQLGAYILPYGVKDGDVLVRNPYESEPTYVRATEAAIELWKGKCVKVIDLMGRLGAAKCQFESCTVESKRRERCSKVSGQYKLVKADVKVNQQIEEKCKKKLELTSVTALEPIELTHEEWAEVKQYAIESNLWQEADIRTIIIQREPGVKRRELKTFSLTCEVSSECNKILDTAFGLSACGAFSLNAEVQDKISLHNETTVKYIVDF